MAEIQEITTGIASNARTAFRNRDAIVESRPYLSEFGYMALIFMAKSMIYFLMRDSYSHEAEILKRASLIEQLINAL
ncbi:MAG: hypothetical protein NUK65_09730, partial [Firmicutes bacterium]|nr:hypothetical protein [Bacillota bacterium]